MHGGRSHSNLESTEPVWKARSVTRRRVEFALLAGAAVGALVIIAISVLGSSDTTTPSTGAAVESVFDAEPTGLRDLVELDLGQNLLEPDTPLGGARVDGGCTIGALSLRLGASGDGVTCLQNALAGAGLFGGTPTGEFDQATLQAAYTYQSSAGLFVDGVIGRETALALGIWPDEESLVVRTPVPASGAKDLWGVELSPVASAGDDAPPLPANSGTGRRVVYDRAGQRVWAVRADGLILRSWLVSGSTYSNEEPGTHQVYSRSDESTAWNGEAILPQMIRWLKTDIGAIGFHAIPLHVEDRSPYQTSDELGTRLSGGCQRQHNLDSAFLWAFATLGTSVVVT